MRLGCAKVGELGRPFFVFRLFEAVVLVCMLIGALQSDGVPDFRLLTWASLILIAGTRPPAGAVTSVRQIRHGSFGFSDHQSHSTVTALCHPSHVSSQHNYSTSQPQHSHSPIPPLTCRAVAALSSLRCRLVCGSVLWNRMSVGIVCLLESYVCIICLLESLFGLSWYVCCPIIVPSTNADR